MSPEATSPDPVDAVAAAHDFEARLRMLERVGPMLQRLADSGLAIIVEGERRTQVPEGLESDFVVEYGDLRLRVLLLPETQLSDGDLRKQLQRYFVNVPDTDAVAIVKDDEELSCRVFDIYDVQDAVAGSVEQEPLPNAIAAYFDRNVFAVEIPNFRELASLPSADEVRNELTRAIEAEFEVVRTRKVRIRERSKALESLTPEHKARLSQVLGKLLTGDAMSLDEVLAQVDRVEP